MFYVLVFWEKRFFQAPFQFENPQSGHIDMEIYYLALKLEI